MTAFDLSSLLSARSVAVVGAAERPGNLGKAILDNLRRFGFAGPVWPVHPSAAPVGGERCYPSLRDLPGTAEMAVFVVGAASLAGAVRDAIAAGTRAGIAIAGGFAELGAEGQARQEALARMCSESGFALCGPNCIGIINAPAAMAATFGSSLLESRALPVGNISIVSQSGGLATFVQALAARAGFGVRYVVSSGNEAVLTTADFISAFAADPGTRVICTYVEGLREPERLLVALSKARELHKPVVMLKAGSSPASALAAMAHTGALAGEERVWNAILREHAVIRAHSLEELLDVALLFSGQTTETLPQGSGVAILGFGGGGGVLGADQCAAAGLSVPRLEPAREESLRALAPPIASLANPFDLTPDAYNKAEYLQRLPDALTAIAGDPAIHSLLFQLGAIAHVADPLMDCICRLRSESDKTIAVAWPLTPPSVSERLPREGIPVFPDAARAIRALGHATRYVADVSASRRAPIGSLPEVEWPALEGPGIVAEPDCHAILARAGLPVAPGAFVPSGKDVGPACASIGFPVALKGIAASITHRAKAGLLELGIGSAAAAQSAAGALVARAAMSSVVLDGIYVQRMMPAGTELLVGAFRDPLFGVMVTCGAGGVMTELIDDVTLERAPVDLSTARRMLGRLRVMRYRDRIAGDLEAVARFVASFSQIVASAPWREFALEVNPVIWNADGVVAVDGLIVVGRS